MKGNVKRVFYVRQVAIPYLDIIAQRPEIRLDKLENETLRPSPSRSWPRRTPTRSVRRATSCCCASMRGATCSRACPTCSSSPPPAPASTPST